MKPISATFDVVSFMIDIGISVFFILYAMSSVGLTLASRAHLDTRWKLTSELAATITFFLASGYLVVQALFEVFAGGFLGVRVPDVIKLFVFPFVALVMELLFIRRSRREPEPVVVPDFTEEPEEEPITEESEEPDIEQEEIVESEEEPSYTEEVEEEDTPDEEEEEPIIEEETDWE